MVLRLGLTEFVKEADDDTLLLCVLDTVPEGEKLEEGVKEDVPQVLMVRVGELVMEGDLLPLMDCEGELVKEEE